MPANQEFSPSQYVGSFVPGDQLRCRGDSVLRTGFFNQSKLRPRRTTTTASIADMEQVDDMWLMDEEAWVGDGRYWYRLP